MNFGVKLEVQMTKEEITEKVLGWQKESKNEKLYPIVIGTYKNRKKNIIEHEAKISGLGLNLHY